VAPSRADELHFNGVHVECRRPRGRIANPSLNNTSGSSCPWAGGVARLHSHDFEGPLVCGCEDLAYGDYG
jgi:hypothetical protein